LQAIVDLNVWAMYGDLNTCYSCLK